MMQKILLFLLLMKFSAVYAQPDSIITIDKLMPGGYFLDAGWKFHSGDNQQWANPDLDDLSWRSLSTATPHGKLKELGKAQIGWFRLKFKISQSLAGKSVAFSISQSGASDIYIDGRLICQYGRVSSIGSQEKTYDPNGEPLTVQLDNRPVHTLAVRYSYTASNYFLANGDDALDIVLMRPADAWDRYSQHFENRNSQRSFVFGVFIILGLLHLIIFLNYRARKVNLYLSLFAFATSVVFFDGLLNPLTHTANASTFFSGIFWIAAPSVDLLLLIIVYNIFDQQRALWFKMLVVLCVAIVPVEFLSNYGASAIYLLAPSGTLVYLEITRIAIIAYRKRKKGSKIFLWGQSIALLFFCGLSYSPYILQVPYLIQLVQLDIAFLTPAVVISFLLAREFAEKNISLQYQLIQVEELSKKTLSQEQEKQTLLASQNEMLEQQVSQRTAELNKSLINLKQTQTQLIQSEKMASLGELTAGIAHEIQNPLNFVNNFSEVNEELLEELKAESKKPKAKRDEHLESELIDDLIENQGKIKHHGKRADNIVKGMLEHSRVNTGQKVLTDLNKLADEYFRLAYHGLRAKDKNFNAELITHFDEKLPRIEIMQQDIGRVLLNLFNNAFYAVNQKRKTARPDYKPEVIVTTSSPRDNGNGIPEAIKDKIMQPFFTTKPTGEGTGLGLSLSYDIVVKGHGGSINVNTKEGEFTEFVITLPA
jgi:two-component system NtrC family sensor kinase